jgi:hypothetical protein
VATYTLQLQPNIRINSRRGVRIENVEATTIVGPVGWPEVPN